MARLCARVVLVVGLVVFTSACEASDDDRAQESVRNALEPVIVESQENNVPQVTLEVLQRAFDEGRPVTIEEVRQGRYRAIECLEEVGFDVRWSDDPTAPGGVNYAWGLPGELEEFPPELDAAGLACDQDYSGWLDVAQQLTSAVPAQSLDQRFAPYREAFTGCLRARGAVVDDDLSAADLLQIGAEADVVDGHEYPCVVVVGFDAEG